MGMQANGPVCVRKAYRANSAVGEKANLLRRSILRPADTAERRQVRSVCCSVVVFSVGAPVQLSSKYWHVFLTWVHVGYAKPAVSPRTCLGNDQVWRNAPPVEDQLAL
jgi:hypothetical protein